MRFAVVLFALALLVAIIIGARFFKNEACARYLGNVSTYKQIHYCVALLVVLAVWFQLPPAAIFADPQIGGQVLALAGTVMSTVSISAAGSSYSYSSRASLSSSAPCWSL